MLACLLKRALTLSAARCWNRSGVVQCFLAFLLMAQTPVQGHAAGPCALLPESGSPNGEFALATCKLDKGKWEENADGVTLDESLFIVESKTGRVVQEISKDYRRSSSAALPEYKPAWGNDSKRLAVVARFRRSSELEGYELIDHQWKRLPFAPFDPLEYAKNKLNPQEPFTGESEISAVEWNGAGELKVEAIAYIKTDQPAEMTINYAYDFEHGTWKLRIVSSEIRTD
jgi:hypothetical protein